MSSSPLRDGAWRPDGDGANTSSSPPPTRRHRHHRRWWCLCARRWRASEGPSSPYGLAPSIETDRPSSLLEPSAAAATATTAVAVGTAMANDDATRTMLLNLDIPNVSNRREFSYFSFLTLKFEEPSEGLCPLQCDSCHIIIRRRMREVFAWFLFSESVSRRRQVPENYWLLSANVMMSAGNFLSQRTAFLW